MNRDYKAEYQAAIDNPVDFWLAAANLLPWYTPPETLLSEDVPGFQSWFPDGVMNTCHMALDHHVENGRADQPALIYDSPVTGVKETYTYRSALGRVKRIAGMLEAKGVEKGDRVVIYMPMIPEAAFAMLACARLGAVHSVVFGGFAARELAIRIDDAEPKVVLSASCGIECEKIIKYKPLLDNALEISSHTPDSVIVYQRVQAVAKLIQGRDHEWQILESSASDAECVPVHGSDPLYILYTSGTTGKPKGVVRENGGHAVAMHYSMKAIYDVDAGDVFWAASDVGWVVGHSYIVYAPLLRGCTSIMYEGKPVGTPDAGAFWRVAEEYKVKALFSAPTAFRAIKKEDPEGEHSRKYDLSNLSRIFSAGERLDPPTYEWLCETLQRPVIDHWWQTETGWAIAANMTGIEELPCKAGSATVPVPGYHIEILDDQGKPLPQGQQGNIAIRLPLPPSCFNTIWRDEARYKDSYLSTFDGYYTSGDGGYLDEDGYLHVMGRLDDVINVAGHRLSTGEMEEVICMHPAVAEGAVVARDDELKGHLPVGFAVLKSGVEADSESVSREIVQLVREKIGPVACLREVHICSRLPKTRSGKTLRKTIKQIINGLEYTVPSTIDDPSSLDGIKAIASEQKDSLKVAQMS